MFFWYQDHAVQTRAVCLFVRDFKTNERNSTQKETLKKHTEVKNLNV